MDFWEAQYRSWPQKDYVKSSASCLRHGTGTSGSVPECVTTPVVGQATTSSIAASISVPLNYVST